MTLAYWAIVAAVVVVAAGWMLWTWLRPRVRPVEADDLDALTRAVIMPRPVLTVVRLHTGALAVTYSALTVNEALDVGTQCIHAAMATAYEHTGICDAEAFANGETA